jgi:3',5'-cyclic AMP phosphodiesterase CpdA
VRLVAHISDLHFGREDPRVVEGLRDDLLRHAPAVVVVSGDLTQRARRSEFAAARAFLDTLPFPRVVVPGNHDVPLYNVARRLARPLDRFREFLGDPEPVYADGEIAVVGINTARSLTWKSGRISRRQVDGIRRTLCPLSERVLKIAVTHHQFIPPPGRPATDLVGRAPRALEALETCGVDMLLAGHVHLGYTGDVRATHPSTRRSIVVVQAGTAVSRRSRGEANSYNLVAVERDRLAVAVRRWDGRGFAGAEAVTYVRRGDHWAAEP